MLILDLVLKGHWYDLIKSGRKTYEYREIKPYWTKRLFSRAYTHVRFRRGYTKESMVFELVSIEESSEQNDLELPAVYKLTLGPKVKEE